LFFSILASSYHLLRTIWRIGETMRFSHPIKLRRALYLTIPFLRWLLDTRFVGPHATTPIKLSDITGVLLHFRFVKDFFSGVRDRGSKRALGWAGEYARYLAKLEDDPSLSFHYSSSVEHEGSGRMRIRRARRGEITGEKATASAARSRYPLGVVPRSLGGPCQ
jgi:hypothetical protein